MHNKEEVEISQNRIDRMCAQMCVQGLGFRHNVSNHQHKAPRLLHYVHHHLILLLLLQESIVIVVVSAKKIF